MGPTTAMLSLEERAALEIGRSLPSNKPAGGTLVPGTVEWYAHLEYKRYRRVGRWLPALLDFSRHQGESVFVLGDGLGTDWVRYAHAGAKVTLCAARQEQLQQWRELFVMRGASGQFVHAAPTVWPVADERYDVVCSFYHATPTIDVEQLRREVLRVLRPGGKWLFVAPRRSVPHRQCEALLRDFTEGELYTRHLRREEAPWWCRWVPLPLLERVCGRFVIIKAFKPVQVQRSLRVAA